jgi:hypothetical protein
VSAAKVSDPVATIIEATGRSSLADAIAWIGEGHPMPATTNWTRLLQALVEAGEKDIDRDALRRVTREVADSDVDTARLVFDPDDLPTIEDFDRAVEALLSRSSDGTFGGLSARGVLRAQRAEPLAIEALCLAAGIQESDARGWFGVSRTWREPQVVELLGYLRELVDGEIESPLPHSVAARALELIQGFDGWDTIDNLQANGVPYGLLLAQRAVGGVWLANKNKTSNRPNQVAAGEVCAELAARGIKYRRATTAGGEVRQKDLQDLAKIDDKRVGVVAVDSKGQPTFAITFSAARDGGTARANRDGLLQIPRTDLRHALVLVGIGWAPRHETDLLALHFDGFLFSDRSIGDLVDAVEAVTL